MAAQDHRDHSECTGTGSGTAAICTSAICFVSVSCMFGPGLSADHHEVWVSHTVDLSFEGSFAQCALHCKLTVCDVLLQIKT